MLEGGWGRLYSIVYLYNNMSDQKETSQTVFQDERASVVRGEILEAKMLRCRGDWEKDARVEHDIRANALNSENGSPEFNTEALAANDSTGVQRRKG